MLSYYHPLSYHSVGTTANKKKSSHTNNGWVDKFAQRDKEKCRLVEHSWCSGTHWKRRSWLFHPILVSCISFVRLFASPLFVVAVPSLFLVLHSRSGPGSSNAHSMSICLFFAALCNFLWEFSLHRHIPTTKWASDHLGARSARASLLSQVE